MTETSEKISHGVRLSSLICSKSSEKLNDVTHLGVTSFFSFFVSLRDQENTFRLTERWKAARIRSAPMHLVYFGIIAERGTETAPDQSSLMLM